jgi:sensor histidine kinase YesM
MRRRPFSIKNAIRFSLVAVFIVIFATVSIYYFGVYRYSRVQLNNSHVKLAATINRELESMLSLSDAAAKRVLYSASVQALVFSRSPIEYIRNRQSAMSFLENAAQGNALIRDIYIYCEDGNALFYATGWNSRKWYAQLISDEVIAGGDLTPRFITTAYYDRDADNKLVTKLLYYVPMYNVRTPHTPEGRLAHAVVVCDVSAFLSMISTDLYAREMIALLYGAELISSNRASAAEYTRAVVSGDAPLSPSGTVTIGGEDFLYERLALQALGEWSVAYLVPEESLIEHIIYIRNISIPVLVLSLIAIAAFMESIIRTIFKQINILSGCILDVRKGSKAQVEITNLAELMPVVTEFNETIAAIKKSQEKEISLNHELYRAVIARQAAAITSYKYQITPHFLFNIMETMRSMAHSNDTNELERLIVSTSAFLRYILRENTSVALEKELEFIKVYFNIMEIRYPNRFRLRIDASDAARGGEILTTVLQPLIENCFNHALSPKKKTLLVCVKAEMLREGDGDDYLRVSVTDNGSGIQDGTMEMLRKYMRRENMGDAQIHTGLNNIYHRMLLYFGSGFDMDVRTKAGRYTRIELKIPQGENRADKR